MPGERMPQAVRRELPPHRLELLLDPDGLHHPAGLPDRDLEQLLLRTALPLVLRDQIIIFTWYDPP